MPGAVVRHSPTATAPTAFETALDTEKTAVASAGGKEVLTFLGTSGVI